jgi:acyl-CoA thioester hydrolase
MEHAGTTFTLPLAVRWADLDPNGHVRHSVYYDWGAMARIGYLASVGVGPAWMAAQAIGPVMFREEARFQREVRFGDELSVDVRLSASSPDARKWQMRHRVLRGAELAATIELDGAWLDLRARKVVAPPPEMVRAFDQLARTEDFTVLPSRKDGPPTPAS